jgi:hypothetical protein
MPRIPATPTATYGDSSTVGQLAKQWNKSHDFVRRMIANGKLATDARGLVTNESLRDFYAQHSTELG